MPLPRTSIRRRSVARAELVRPARGARPVRTARTGPAVLAALTALGLLLGGFALTGTAFAHNVLSGSDPADGASLDSAPSRVRLTFNQPVQPSFSTVIVVGPDGGQYGDGAPRVTGDTVELSVRPLGPAGRYTIGYRVISDDGHPVTGSIGFTLATAGPGAPSTPGAPAPGAPGRPGAPGAAAPGAPGAPGAPANPRVPGASADPEASPEASPPAAGPEPAPGGGMPAWPWILGAAVLVGAGATLAHRAGRS